ncbi:ATP phosphoribosyltransferase regulatory subunit [hydrothermal vent metagenome]|uniref:ATP phosphoribosyltransferase regulatory subunit n=1 Tax=hydrothermal vent metagenome TaxID=652676 RepID=A0A3B1BWT4_9ZZZZ
MIDVPRGVKALLYEEASLKNWVENEVLSVFTKWGFQKTETPAIEFLHVLSKGLEQNDLRRIITFSDPAGGGKPLALRSDVTPQIARISATTLKNRPAPIRLSYAESVFRSIAPGSGNRMEVFQAGAELIGSSTPETDAEIIAIAIESLTALGFNDIKIAVGHIGYVKETIESLGLGTESEKLIKQAIRKKDLNGIAKVLNAKPVNEKARTAIENITKLFGDVSLLDKVETVNDKAEEAVKNLREVVAVLERLGLGDRVTIDLGEMRGFGYYTGVTFEGFIKGTGRSVLTGGRYDKLLSAYGADRPATGFAIDIDQVIASFDKSEKRKEWSSTNVLVIGTNGSSEQAGRLAQELRKSGFSVARDIIMRPLEESLEYARRMKISYAVITEVDGKIKIIDTKTGNESAVETANLLSDPASFIRI